MQWLFDKPNAAAAYEIKSQDQSKFCLLSKNTKIFNDGKFFGIYAFKSEACCTYRCILYWSLIIK